MAASTVVTKPNQPRIQEPRMVEAPYRLLAGLVACVTDITELDIPGLWRRFEQNRAGIEATEQGVAYELHVQTEQQPQVHYCFVGMPVAAPDVESAELFTKAVPGGRFAVFTHNLADGSFEVAFQRVYEWLAASEFEPARPYDLQRYDERFVGPDNPDSVFEIHVPVRDRVKI